MASPRKRIEFIDLAKGICIILVVLVHSTTSSDQYRFLQALLMPLYFFLAGIFFKEYSGFWATFLNKTDRLLVPAAFFLAIYLLCSMAGHIVIGKDPRESFDIFAPPSQGFRINNAIWFLISLFWQCMIFLAVVKISPSFIIRALIVVILTSIGLICSTHKIILPLNLDSALTALPFFFAGFCYRKANMLNAKRFEWATLCRSIAFIALALWLAKINNYNVIYYQANTFGGFPIIAYFESLALILALLDICRAVKYIPFVSYCGEFSIIILGTHLIFVLAASNLEKYFHADFPEFAVFLIALVFSALMIKPFRKFFPKFTAQKNLFSTPKSLNKYSDKK